MRRDGVIRKTCKRYNIPRNAHELTFSCYKGRGFLSKDLTRGFFAEAILRARRRNPFDLWAYVVMPEHVHLIIWPTSTTYSISLILLSIKQSVARRAVGYLRRNNPEGLKCLATGQKYSPYRFWQDGGGYDRNIYTRDALQEMIDYIHRNPVRRGLVARPQDWVWSSFRDWHGPATGPIPVNKESYFAAVR